MIVPVSLVAGEKERVPEVSHAWSFFDLTTGRYSNGMEKGINFKDYERKPTMNRGTQKLYHARRIESRSPTCYPPRCRIHAMFIRAIILLSLPAAE